MSDKPGFVQVGRLAMRHEGEWWNAYWAQEGSMVDAIQLGSMRMSVATASHELKQRFLDLMRDALTEAINDATGIRPTWGEETVAPEHERSGHS